MPRQLQIKYYVEPDPAALARRAAQYFVEMAGEAVAGARTRAHRHQRRLHAQGRLRAARRPQPALAQSHALGRARPLLGRRALRPSRQRRQQLPHDPRGPARSRAAPPRADSPHRGRARARGRRRPLRVGAAQQLPPRRRRDARASTWWPWAWAATATPPRSFRTPQAIHEMSRLVVANHVPQTGRLAHHPHLARHQPRPLGLLPHLRRGQGRCFERSSDRARAIRNACPAS